MYIVEESFIGLLENSVLEYSSSTFASRPWLLSNRGSSPQLFLIPFFSPYNLSHILQFLTVLGTTSILKFTIVSWLCVWTCDSLMRPWASLAPKEKLFLAHHHISINMRHMASAQQMLNSGMYVNKLMHVLGAQGIIYTLLLGVLTDASHTHGKQKKIQKQNTILPVWADIWYPQSRAMVKDKLYELSGPPTLYILSSPSLCLFHSQPLRWTLLQNLKKNQAEVLSCIPDKKGMKRNK